MLFIACQKPETATKKTFTLTVNAENGGSVNTTGGVYEEGHTVTVIASPDNHYRFIRWSNGATQNPYEWIATQNQTISAYFEKLNYELNIAIIGQGEVDEKIVSRGKSTDYVAGTIVRLTAIPSSGWEFSSWSGRVASEESSIEITIDEIKSITATFIESAPKIYLADNGVTILCPNAPIGHKEVVNGKEYVVVDNNSLRRKVANNEAVDCTCTSNVTSMENLFTSKDVFNQDISSWDTSSVLTTRQMFWRAYSFNGNLSAWDMSQVVDMSQMFAYTPSYRGEDLSAWSVSNVINMSEMFRFSSFNGNISSWDVSNVTDMSLMFFEANTFNKDLNTWNVSKVTNMRNMFYNAAAFNGDISTWDVSQVTDMENMFSAATSFNGDLSNWDVSKVTNMRNMFSSASSFNGDLSTWNVSNVNDMSYMFNAAGNFDQDLSSWCVSNISSLPLGFAGYSKLTLSNYPIWGTCPSGK